MGNTDSYYKEDAGIVTINNAPTIQTPKNRKLSAILVVEDLPKIEEPLFNDNELKKYLLTLQNEESNIGDTLRNHFNPLTKSALKNQEIIQKRLNDSFSTARNAIHASTDATKQLHAFSKHLDNTLPAINESLAQVIKNTESALQRVEILRQLLPLRSYSLPIESFEAHYKNSHPPIHEKIKLVSTPRSVKSPVVTTPKSCASPTPSDFRLNNAFTQIGPDSPLYPFVK